MTKTPKNNEPKQQYRLPTVPASWTTSVLQSGRVWKRVAKPIEKATGYKLTSFDPGFSFNKITPAFDFALLYNPKTKRTVRKKTRRVDILGNKLSNFSDTISLPVEFVLSLNAAINHK